MKATTIAITALLALSGTLASAQSKRSLTYWFDKPTTLGGQAVWYGGHPERWTTKKPEAAGDTGQNPDPEWESQSLPIGNGSLGANIMGSVEAERITFNEKSLWRGGPNTSNDASRYWNVNKQSAQVIGQIRDAFAAGNWDEAAQLTRKNFNSTVPYESYAESPFRFGNFTTMGEFYIETGLSTVGMTHYRRSLSLDSALAVVQFDKDGTHYRREYFASYPANVVVVRFKANRPGMQNLTFTYAPNPVSTGETRPDAGSNGLCHVARLDNNHMQYAVRIRAINRGGTVSNDGAKLRVSGADEVTFIISADTDYKENFNPDFNNPATYVGTAPVLTTEKWANAAAEKGYDRLLAEHLADYSQQFGKVSLQLNGSDTTTDGTPINERLANYRKGKADFGLEELYYQFGRYLLIASSRPGNLPANLQGVWHNNVDGPWRVDYHNNINLQMNYWPACATGLSECELPLFNFIRGLIKPGTLTAKAYFGTRGWTTSVSGNIFGFTSPLASEDMSWNFSPFAGPWLATHLWDYYDYMRDRHFLENNYDIIKGSANFAADYLWHRPDGVYTAAPSTSPEHGPVDEGATFAHAVIREILTDAIEASRILGKNTADRKLWEDALKHLAPYKTGRYGQLMEWSRDIDDPKDEHRHVNHLFGLHPGHTISPVTTPQLAKAARIVLEHRGDGATGWSMGWKLNQWARLHDGNHAYLLFGNLLKNGTLDNLWDTHAPFQIDGNFGGTAGVTEMLMQSHMGFVHLLPALPDAWKDGVIKGLRARGNFTVDIAWKDGALDHADIHSGSGTPCTVRYGNIPLQFKTTKGKTYRVTFNNGKGSAKAL